MKYSFKKKLLKRGKGRPEYSYYTQEFKEKYLGRCTYYDRRPITDPPKQPKTLPHVVPVRTADGKSYEFGCLLCRASTKSNNMCRFSRLEGFHNDKSNPFLQELTYNIEVVDCCAIYRKKRFGKKLFKEILELRREYFANDPELLQACTSYDSTFFEQCPLFTPNEEELTKLLDEFLLDEDCQKCFMLQSVNEITKFHLVGIESGGSCNCWELVNEVFLE